MSFNAIRENKILAKISEFTVYLYTFTFRIEYRQFKQYSPPAGLTPDYGFGSSLPHPSAFSVHQQRRTTVQQILPTAIPGDIGAFPGLRAQPIPLSGFTNLGPYQSIGQNGRVSPGYQNSSGRPPNISMFSVDPASFQRPLSSVDHGGTTYDTSR